MGGKEVESEREEQPVVGKDLKIRKSQRQLCKEHDSRKGKSFLHLLPRFSFIWLVSHSTPSCKPSPVIALEAVMCQGLSLMRSSPSAADTFTLLTASRMSILLAKNRMGRRRDRICKRVFHQFIYLFINLFIYLLLCLC